MPAKSSSRAAVGAPAARRPVRSPQGRKPVISRDDLVEAALTLVGPHRSISTVSLREVARQAGIAPNSFYRQFRDMDELAVALIDRAGLSLREIIIEARERATRESSIVRASVETFVTQLRGGDKLLHVLLRESSVGSPAFKAAVDRQLSYFEDELRQDLIRIAEATNSTIHEPATAAKAITRLVFGMGSTMMEQPAGRDAEITEQMITMVRIILLGAQKLGTLADARSRSSVTERRRTRAKP